jgi:hypothetical protein
MILERVFSGTLAGAETIKLRPYPAPLPHLSSPVTSDTFVGSCVDHDRDHHLLSIMESGLT